MNIVSTIPAKYFKKRIRILKYSELIFWITALTLLGVMDTGTDPHFSFCILNLIGIDFCPGCGIGHSISHLLHGELSRSFSAHPLGIFALPVISLRIITLLRFHFLK